ncbi:MAG: hypothetical protein ACF8R7_14525 [Phycisphaerales bacterium JB039]
MIAQRGAILLEIILSVALFTLGALAILTQMSQGARSIEGARLARQAADLAATTMARIEAGISAPEALSGPASRWDGEQQASLADLLDPGAPIEIYDDAMQEETGWELLVDTEPAPFDGLTLVTVTATFADPARAGAPGASYTLRQLVRLGLAPEDTIGDEDALQREVERGARPAPRGGQP